jgi:hypothetical protein
MTNRQRLASLYGLIDELRKRYRLHEFVETGTHMGYTASLMAQSFDVVRTIELDPATMQHAQMLFAEMHIRNIYSVLGDSRDVLSDVLAQVKGKALIFLDAHWGPDLRYARPERGECPLGEELITISKAHDYHVILIHDKHLFMGNVPEGHDPKQWPNVADILTFAADYEYHLSVYDQADCIVLIPDFIMECDSHE